MKKILVLIFSFFLVFLGQIKSQCTFTLTNTVLDSSCAPSMPYCSGEYILKAGSGTPPYNWPTGRSYKTIDTIYFVCPGTYTVNVTDSLGCTGTTIVNISQYKTLLVDSFHVNKLPSCDTCCDGSISVYVVGQDAPCNVPAYTFIWTPGGMYFQTLTNACAGIQYTCCVTDADAYTSCDTITVHSPPPAKVQQNNAASFNLSVYPNPTNTILNIHITLREGEVIYFNLYNAMGQQIQRMQLKNNLTALLLNNYSTGLYYYRIIDSNGNVLKADKQMVIH